MQTFHYKGRTQRGDAIEGNIEANSSGAVASQLINNGVTPIDIVEAKVRQDTWGDLKRQLGGGQPGLDDVILFSRQMYTLMKAGVPIVRSINGLATSVRNPIMAETLNTIVEGLESGRELSSTFAQHPKIFSSLFVSMIQVGENTGRLDEAFLQVSQHLELEKETRDRIKAALRYPSFVLMAITAAMFIINIFVIPAFASVFASFKAELPLPTRVLIATSDFTIAYWPYLLAAIVGGIFAFRYYIKTDNGRYVWDRTKLRIPVVGSIIMRSLLARFSRSFAMATRAGVPLVQALTVVARAVDNEFVGDRIRQMRTGVERGDTLTRTAAATDMFTPLVLQMLAVGEETGAVDDMLGEVADFYEREVDYDLKNLSAALEPILLLIIAGMVLVLALGVFLPMWDLGKVALGR